MSHEGSAPLWRLLGLLDKVKKSGTGYEARCPGARHKHEDKHPSLSLGLGYDGRVLLNCHAGCATDDILNALQLEWTDLFEKSNAGNVVRRYRLLNGSGHVVAEHVREELAGDKRLWWEHTGKRGLNGTALSDLPLYRQPEIESARADVPVIVTEGEKAADALADLGVLAVATVTGAAGTPSADVLSVLRGREVWLWPDNDDVGRAHMERIAQALTPAPRWIDWKEAPEHGDAADWVTSGGQATDLKGLLRLETTAGLAGPRIWRATELMAMRFDSTRWAIPGLLPAGLAILAGRPKLGKSWLGLGWTIDVSRGGQVLKKMDVVQGETLYLALEDGPQRMQERLALMLGEDPAPAALSVATEWPRMNEGGLDLLDQWLTAHPAARMVTIDTFKKVRPKEKGNQRLYDLDYDAIAPVAALARKHNVAIVVVFHTRKGASDDPLEMVSGTLGLSGAADCVLVLRRERGQADASLFVTGRDVEEQDLALRWEKDDTLGWSLLGNAENFRRSKERQQVLDAIQAMPGMRPIELADALGKSRNAVRQLLFNMTRGQEIRVRDGKYWPGAIRNNDNSDNRQSQTTETPITDPVTAVTDVSPITPVIAVIADGPTRAIRDDPATVCRRCGRSAETHGIDDPISCRWMALEDLV